MSEQVWTEAENDANDAAEKALIDAYLAATAADPRWPEVLRENAAVEVDSWIQLLTFEEFQKTMPTALSWGAADRLTDALELPPVANFERALDEVYAENKRFFEWWSQQVGYEDRAAVLEWVESLDRPKLIQESRDFWREMTSRVRSGELEPPRRGLSAEDKKARKKKNKAQKAARKKAKKR